MLGWARGDARALGQHTRLFARALVLQRGPRRLALVAMDLNMVSGGLVVQAARRAGFDPRELIVSASHTHAGPTGYSNFLFKDAAFPTPAEPQSGVTQPDPLLYTFLVRRLTLALERARADAGPAAAAWGHTTLTGVTENRSIEAHLADHGIELPRGAGRAAQDPDGAAHTIDPNVDVLRVDRLAPGRRVPLGAWSTFANHGTVNRSTFGYYNADHHATAARVFEAGVRRAGRVPRRRPVVNVYGNSDAGDVSAGLHAYGPAQAERVGRREAAAMLTAWRRAGAALTRTPRLESRWTRVCFCGQSTAAGPLADHAVFGTSYLTGSEEGRGPLFDATGDIYEGRRLSAPEGVQGVKVAARSDDDRTLEPTAVPLTAVRLGDHLIVTIPGEATSELGRRTRAAVLAAARPAGVRRVVVAGYANEYASYFTTPEEYGAQHYEGGTTVYGPASGPFLTTSLADLARRLARGQPAPAPYPFDPIRGLRPTARAYPAGAARGRALGRRGRRRGSATPCSAGAAGRRAPTGRSTRPSSASSAAPAGAGRRSTPTLGCASCGASPTAARPSSGRRASAPGSRGRIAHSGSLRCRRRRAPTASPSARAATGCARVRSGSSPRPRSPRPSRAGRAPRWCGSPTRRPCRSGTSPPARRSPPPAQSRLRSPAGA